MAQVYAQPLKFYDDMMKFHISVLQALSNIHFDIYYNFMYAASCKARKI